MTMSSTIVAAPSAAPSTRARDILKDMRQKRELLVSNNPSLQKHVHAKPPTAPKIKTRESSTSSSIGSNRAQEILGDMKQKRASLTAVLEACKSPGSPRKKRDRSIGLSTAPTAASTRSWISSIADDGSCCYSETSREDGSPRESSIEFIIDTEDSDLYSLSTREELGQVVGAICEEVVPKALNAIHRRHNSDCIAPEQSETLSKTSTTTSWTFRTESSARNLYREERIRNSLSEKKKRRIQISEKRKQESSRSCSGGSSYKYPVDLQEVRRQRSNLKSMLDSISEIKEATNPNISLPRNSSQPTHHRLRQDDSSAGSAPLSSRPSSKASGAGRESARSSSKSSSSQVEFVLPSSLKDKNRKKKSSDSSIASHYVLETKFKHGRQKKIVVKPTEMYVAPTPDPAYIVPPIESDAEQSLLASPITSVADESLLVTPEYSEAKQSEILSTPPPQSPPTISNHGHSGNVQDTGSNRSHRTHRSSDEKSTRIASVPISHNPYSVEVPQQTSLDLAVPTTTKVEPQVNVWEYTRMESTPLEPQSQEDEVMPTTLAVKEITMDDIMMEMKRLAAHLGNVGLTIPIGTEITLRRGSNNDVPDDCSGTGWSFTEPSVISRCTNIDTDTYMSSTPESNCTERFCGGMYHLAVLSGMPPCDEENVE